MNHHVWWENPLFLWPFSIANCWHHQRVAEAQAMKGLESKSLGRNPGIFGPPGLANRTISGDPGVPNRENHIPNLPQKNREKITERGWDDQFCRPGSSPKKGPWALIFPRKTTSTCIQFNRNQQTIQLIIFPSGKRLHNYENWHNYSWSTYYKWWFSIAMLVHQRVPYLWYPWTSLSSAHGDPSYGKPSGVMKHSNWTSHIHNSMFYYKPPCYRGCSFIFQHFPMIFQHFPMMFIDFPAVSHDFPMSKPPFWRAKQRFGIHQVDAIEMTRLGRRWDSTNKKKVASPAKNIGKYICEEKKIGIYPLVNVYITIENHHFEWVNQL